MAKLPVTKARSSLSVKLYIIPQDVDITIMTSTNIASLTAVAKVVGAIESFSEANPRTTNPRYELNSDNPGEIVERMPTLADRTLTINRAVLYTSDIMQLLGVNDFNDVIDNYKAFAIMKQEIAPEGSGVPTKVTIFTGCWFHDFPKEYNLSGNMKIIQNVGVGYTSRTVQYL